MVQDVQYLGPFWQRPDDVAGQGERNAWQMCLKPRSRFRFATDDEVRVAHIHFPHPPLVRTQLETGKRQCIKEQERISKVKTRFHTGGEGERIAWTQKVYWLESKLLDQVSRIVYLLARSD